MQKWMRHTLCFLGILCTMHTVRAGQFLGGEIGYRVISAGTNGNDYEIIFRMYRNCLSMADLNAPRIWILNSIAVGPVTQTYSLTLTETSRRRMQQTKLPACVINTPADCYDYIEFKGTIFLPHSLQGYTLYYTECCRDQPQKNLEPLSWNGGAEMVNGVPEPGQSLTYWATIPPEAKASVNNTPVLVADSVISACKGDPLYYDFEFTDADGDSLMYYFGDVTGKTDALTISFRSLTHLSPYNALSPMGGSPEVQLDKFTCKLYGVPDATGRFTIVVDIYEYRNGQLINIHKKEIQINVTECNASLTNPPVNCENTMVQFFSQVNNPGLQYHWDFGVAGMENDTSNSAFPFYSYPTPGEYTVTMIIRNPAGCADTAQALAKVFPGLRANFTWNQPLCNGTPLQLRNISDPGLGRITAYEWRYISGRGEVVFSRERDPVFNYTAPPDREETFSIQLTVTSSLGCRSTLLDVPVVYPVPQAFAGPDTTISFDYSYQMPVKPNNSYKYSWQPAAGLSNPLIANPEVTGRANQTYILRVASTNNVCFSYDTVHISFAKGPDIYVPTAFTPNGDNLNDELGFRPVHVRVQQFEVYNRYGSRVHSSTDSGKTWNGKVKGLAQDSGIYVWYARGILPDGKPFVKRGTVLLIR